MDEIENVTPLESALLCFDGAIKQLQEGKDAKSHLFQGCMQLSRHCKLHGHSVATQSFEKKAEVIKAIKTETEEKIQDIMIRLSNSYDGTPVLYGSEKILEALHEAYELGRKQ